MILNNQSFLLYAAKNYDAKVSTGTEDFYDDLKRFQYLKRLFKKYQDNGDLKVRLVLNHLIILYNCFGPSTTNMLFFKLQDHHKQLKPFVLFLNFMPEMVEYDKTQLRNSSIPLDPNIIEQLRKI